MQKLKIMTMKNAVVALVAAVVALSSTASAQTLTETLSPIHSIVATAYDASAKDQDLINQLRQNINNGEMSLRLLRSYSVGGRRDVESAVLASLLNAIGVDKQTYPEDFVAKNSWGQILYQYAAGEEHIGEPMYEAVNRDLRDNHPDTDETIEWTRRMREALVRLPKFDGLSFRGTRLSPEKANSYYHVGTAAKDAAFISTSLSATVGFRFAKYSSAFLDLEGTDGKVGLIMVIQGKTGRPISYFANGYAQEQEILFANGTAMVVEAKSPVFWDAEFQKTQIVILKEL